MTEVLLGLPAVLAQQAAAEAAGAGTEIGAGLARFVNHAATAGTVGFLLAAAWLLQPSGNRARLTDTGRRAARIGAVSAVVWAVSAIPVLLLGLADRAGLPVGQALSGDTFGEALRSRFGIAVIAQGVLALVTAVLAWRAKDRRSARIALGVAILACVAPPVWGHPAEARLSGFAVVSGWLHVAAAAAWLGGLAAFVLLVLPGPADRVAGPAARYAKAANRALLILLATGLLNLLLNLDSVSSLVDRPWGQFGLAKVAALVLLAVVGWRIRSSWLPRMRKARTRGEAHAGLRRFVGLELLLLVAAVGLSAGMATADAPAVGTAPVTVTSEFGDGSVSVTVSPARTGPNELHLFVFDATGAQRPVTDMDVVLRLGEEEVRASLVDAGPGHAIAPAVELPTAGDWQMQVSASDESGETLEATESVTIR